MWLIYQVFRGVLVVSGTGEAAQSPFSDVPQDHWAYDAVAQLAADGVIEGYGDTTFQGSKPITRFEMSQMVAKAMAARDAKHVGASDSALIDKLSAEVGAKYFWGKGVQNDKDMTFVRTEIKYFF